MAPLSYTSRISQNNRVSYNCHVFPRISVVLVQLLKRCKLLRVSRCHFCQKLAPFEILHLSHHFFHFAADFVTLSHSKMAVFPTHWCTASLKKAPPLGGASPYSPLQGRPPGGHRIPHQGTNMSFQYQVPC